VNTLLTKPRQAFHTSTVLTVAITFTQGVLEGGRKVKLTTAAVSVAASTERVVVVCSAAPAPSNSLAERKNSLCVRLYVCYLLGANEE